ncbi:hypothetical protein PHYPO_G00080210 [Pangasianodon hypophthalmus]|uniref:Ig-like domain-containing protein n=1 Tax=Pangasianodon hypophthalmus TaxID=310915 RepID=A0A5N5LLF6_PANHP|nr:hypothetical protein PHYPO_G00080210 [Pangasianodon hypophthalmus]
MKILVEWVKEEVKEPSLCTYYIFSNETLSISQCGPRFKVNTEPLGLNITGVESNDAGVYKCVMTKLIPPPAAENSSTLMLKVSSFTLQLMNSTNSSCVELLCSLKGLKPQQVNFTWTRATQLLYHHESSSMRSTLTLCKPHWTDGETLTCQASYSNNHTLYRKSITLPCDSGSFVHLIVLGTLVGLLIGTALFIEVYYQCLTARRRQSTADGIVTSELVSSSQV